MKFRRFSDNKDGLTMQKEIYVQTQNWARHNETLIIATNTVLLGAIAAISANYLKVTNEYSPNLFWLPLGLGIIGMLTTIYLSRQYKLAITRVVVYEKFFKLHKNCVGICEHSEGHSGFGSKWGNSFVPKYLHTPPKFGAASSWFFLFLHFLVILICACCLAKYKSCF